MFPLVLYNIHVHAVVGSDKKLGKYEGKLLSNSHTKERLIVKDLVILTGRSDSLEVRVEVPTVRVRLLQCEVASSLERQSHHSSGELSSQ